jgi:hypothetical protein
MPFSRLALVTLSLILAGWALPLTAAAQRATKPASPVPATGAAARRATKPASPVAAPGATAQRHPQESLLAQGQHEFYNGRYDSAAAIALRLRGSDPKSLASYELRTSALLFTIKGRMGSGADQGSSLAACSTCGPLIKTFLDEIVAGQALARARLASRPTDLDTRFLLGKLDLNYVWLQVGTLGRRTGWANYQEGRRSLDTVLASDPTNVRARVARAWIDYIVDTKVPRGAKWIVGGGNRKRALIAVRQAAQTNAERYVQAEADFALWEMLVRERDLPAATLVAQTLSHDFPENADVAAFLTAQRAAPRGEAPRRAGLLAPPPVSRAGLR